MIFPYYFTSSSVDYNRSMIFLSSNWLDSSKDLVSLALPNLTEGTRLHVFSLSLLPATSKVNNTSQLEIQYARSTQTWMEGTDKTQIVEVVVNNIGSKWVLAEDNVRVQVSSDGVETVVPGMHHLEDQTHEYPSIDLQCRCYQ